jgi:ABC-type Zn uptake system ZnuABC Zn-binding protein ZnuA
MKKLLMFAMILGLAATVVGCGPAPTSTSKKPDGTTTTTTSKKEG